MMRLLALSVLIATLGVAFSKPTANKGELFKKLLGLLDHEKRSCGSYSSEITSSQAQAIVDKHNAFRKAAGSSNMIKLTWSDELADRAQAWADQCRDGHGVKNDCSNNVMGQNAYTAWRSNAPNPADAVTSWHSEEPFFDYANNYCYKSSRNGKPNKAHACGHYTQVTWAKTSEVGCGFKQCPDTDFGGRYGPKWIVICDYRTAGNFNGNIPFLKGTACSQCGSGVGCDNGLCASGSGSNSGGGNSNNGGGNSNNGGGNSNNGGGNSNNGGGNSNNGGGNSVSNVGCASSPCQNGGTCATLSSSMYYCRCPSAWTGQYCQKSAANPCSPNPCPSYSPRCYTSSSSTSYSCGSSGPCTPKTTAHHGCY